MPRPRKKSVEFNAESLKGILQSIYNEAEETGVKATTQYSKQNRDVKDNQDIALVSKINSEYLKIRNDTTEKKLSVARIMKDIIYKDAANTSGDSNSNNGGVLMKEEDKKAIYEMVKRKAEEDNIDFYLKEDNEKDEPF